MKMKTNQLLLLLLLLLVSPSKVETIPKHMLLRKRLHRNIKCMR
jgi:hypothetical protein